MARDGTTPTPERDVHFRAASRRPARGSGPPAAVPSNWSPTCTTTTPCGRRSTGWRPSGAGSTCWSTTPWTPPRAAWCPSSTCTSPSSRPSCPPTPWRRSSSSRPSSPGCWPGEAAPWSTSRPTPPPRTHRAPSARAAGASRTPPPRRRPTGSPRCWPSSSATGGSGPTTSIPGYVETERQVVNAEALGLVGHYTRGTALGPGGRHRLDGRPPRSPGERPDGARPKLALVRGAPSRLAVPMTAPTDHPPAGGPGGSDATGTPTVTVYWRPGCPFCSSLRRGLRRAGLPTAGDGHLGGPGGGGVRARPCRGQRDGADGRHRGDRAGEPVGPCRGVRSRGGWGSCATPAPGGWFRRRRV